MLWPQNLFASADNQVNINKSITYHNNIYRIDLIPELQLFIYLLYTLHFSCYIVLFDTLFDILVSKMEAVFG